MKILVVDDHAVVRGGLIQLMKKAFPEATFAEAMDEARALGLLKASACDFCLLDLNLKGLSGLGTLRTIRKLYPSLPVLVLSMHSEDEFGVGALKAGAQGYLSKEAAPEMLVEAIRQILAGKKFISQHLSERLVLALSDPVDRSSPAQCLSERETAVMKLLCQGIQGKQVAAELDIHPKTVSTYRTRILKKLHLRSTAELIQFALKHKLLDP